MKKKLLSILLVLSLMLALVPAAFAADIAASGTCGAEGDGSNVTWMIDAAGTLTFTGTGAMRDYTAQSGTPWGRSGNAIQAVVVQEGITHIGAYAFFYYTNCRSVSLPSSLVSIGESAFAMNYGLTQLDLPEGLRKLGDMAFMSCRALKRLTVPSTLETIGRNTFSSCGSLSDVTLSEGLTALGRLMFSGDRQLKNITLPQSLTTIGASAFQQTGLLEGRRPDGRQALRQRDVFKLPVAGEHEPAEGGQALGKRHIAERSARAERVPADRLERARNREPLERAAGHERHVTQLPEALRQVELRETVVHGEGTLTDRDQRGRQADGPAIRVVKKGVRADVGDALLHDDCLNGVAAAPPGRAALGSIVAHGAGAGKGQRASGVDHPCDIAAVALGTAGAAGGNVRREGRRHEREHQAQDKQDAQEFLFHVRNSFLFRMIQSSGMGSFQTFSSRQNCARMTAICSRVA